MRRTPQLAFDDIVREPEKYWREVLAESDVVHGILPSPSPAPPPPESDVSHAEIGLFDIERLRRFLKRTNDHETEEMLVVALKLGALLGRFGYSDRIGIGDRRRRQAKGFAAKGARARQARTATETVKLLRDVDAERQVHPSFSTRAIANLLLARHGRSSASRIHDLNALSRKIARAEKRRRSRSGT